MHGLGKALRQRAAALGLSDSEVARRVGLSQARYHNYVSDTAEPDLGTLIRICRTLATSPDHVLDFTQAADEGSDDEHHRARMVSAASALQGEALAYTADLVEAVLAVQRKRPKTGSGQGLVPEGAKVSRRATKAAGGSDEGLLTGSKRRSGR